MKFLFSTLSMLAMAAPSLAFVQPSLPITVGYPWFAKSIRRILSQFAARHLHFLFLVFS